MKRYAESEELFVSANKNLATARRASQGIRRDTLDRIITLYESWGKPDQAAIWRLKRMDSDFPVDPFVH
jgi:hypothetical protein